MRKKHLLIVSVALVFSAVGFVGCASEPVRSLYFGRPNVPEQNQAVLIKPAEISIAYMDIDAKLSQEEKLTEVFRQMSVLGIEQHREMRLLLEAGKHDITLRFDEHKRGSVAQGIAESNATTDSVTISQTFEAGKRYIVRWQSQAGGGAWSAQKLRFWIEPAPEPTPVPQGVQN